MEKLPKRPAIRLTEQVRDGVVAMLESWAGVAPAERLLPNLADYLASPKAGGEGMVTTLQCGYSGFGDSRRCFVFRPVRAWLRDVTALASPKGSLRA